jgi:hypothetical protein
VIDDALDYLLETTRIVSRVHHILLPNGSKIVNDHFVDDSLLLVRVKQEPVYEALA